MKRQCDYFCRWSQNIGTLGQVGCLCGTRGDNTNISDEVLKPDWSETIGGRGFDRFDSLLCPEPIVALFSEEDFLLIQNAQAICITFKQMTTLHDTPKRGPLLNSNIQSPTNDEANLLQNEYFCASALVIHHQYFFHCWLHMISLYFAWALFPRT